MSCLWKVGCHTDKNRYYTLKKGGLCGVVLTNAEVHKCGSKTERNTFCRKSPLMSKANPLRRLPFVCEKVVIDEFTRRQVFYEDRDAPNKSARRTSIRLLRVTFSDIDSRSP